MSRDQETVISEQETEERFYRISQSHVDRLRMLAGRLRDDLKEWTPILPENHRPKNGAMNSVYLIKAILNEDIERIKE